MNRLTRRTIVGSAAIVAALAIGAGVFFGVRTLAGDDSGAGAEFGPFWYAPYFEEDFKKPRLNEQVINGILVGPDLELAPRSGLCQEKGSEAQYVPSEELEQRSGGTPLEINPSYLPEGVKLERAEGAECGGTLVNVVKYYNVPTRENPAELGVLLWSGGVFSVSRNLSTVRQFPLDGAAERVAPMSIKGRPAVVMRPVMPAGVDAGIGAVTIVIADDFGITAIEGDGLPLSEFIRVAESLYGGRQ